MTDEPDHPDEDAALTPPSPYDPNPAEGAAQEEDLWFLPGPDVETPEAPPWMQARPAQEPGLEDWLAAEQRQYRLLLSAAEAQARFGERLRAMPDGLTERIALETTATLLRREGHALRGEQIALYRALRITGAADARVLARANWAVRRLMAGALPGANPQGLHDFLARSWVDDAEALPGGTPIAGDALEARGADWQAALKALEPCHALTRAAFAAEAWRSFGLSAEGSALEGDVAAAIIGSGKAPFVPLGDALPSLPTSTPAADRILHHFCLRAEAGALAALRTLARVEEWHGRAQELIADLSGRIPPGIITAARRFPVFSADLLAETLTCSPAAARRNLICLTERGLLREVTGQTRYRFWAIRA